MAQLTEGRLRDRPSRWAYARALLISLALCSQCVAALPDQPLTRKLLTRPEGKRAVRWTGAVVESLGGDGSPDRVRRELLAISRSILRARNTALRPIRPLLKLTGSRQKWFLFTSSTDLTHRLRIEARERATGQWLVLYRAHHEDRLALEAALTYRRVRGIYNPSANTRKRPQYRGFVDWLATRVLRAHPSYDAVRVSMERLELATRARPNRPAGVDYVVEHTAEPRR